MFEHAYVCRECGEGFAPMHAEDWSSLRKMHKEECEVATFKRTTVEEAF